MNLSENFPNRIREFIITANSNNLKMILVGGGAVNFHGFQRHSADLDFWVNISEQNLSRLLICIQQLGFDISDLPEEVKKGEQNISIKISPVFELELITRFNPGKSFDEAFENSILVEKDDLKYYVLNYLDLINSKITSERIKDKLDVQELQRINLNRKEKN